MSCGDIGAWGFVPKAKVETKTRTKLDRKAETNRHISARPGAAVRLAVEVDGGTGGGGSASTAGPACLGALGR